jgi:hypothetical protein
MTQNEILIYDFMIADMGDTGIIKIDGMIGGDHISWENCMKVYGYKKIIRLHLQQIPPREIASRTGEDYKQVTRIITRFSQGFLTA